MFVKLTEKEKLTELFELSKQKPVILFKHSVTCPISLDVYHEVSGVNAEINLVVVQSDRPVSNEIADLTGIRHESPQAIIIKDGKPIYYASHYDITADDINKNLQ